MINLKKNSYLQVKNVLCEGTVVDGNLQFSDNVKFDGRLTGDLHCAADLVIGETAVIEGDITAQNVMISGHVTGSVTVTGQFCLTKTGKLQGNVQAASMLVEEGGMIQGMSESHRQETPEPDDEEMEEEWDEEEEFEEDVEEEEWDDEEEIEEDEDWDEEDDEEESAAKSTLTGAEAAEVAMVEELLEQEIKAAPIKSIFGMWQKK